MAFSFAAASSEGYRCNTAVVTVEPCTFAAWFYTTSVSALQGLQCMYSSGGGASIQLWLRGDLGNTLEFTVSDGGGAHRAQVAAAVSSGVWYHAAGVAESTTSRKVYFSGGTPGVNTETTALGAMNRAGIAMVGRANYLNGGLAHVCFWNQALTAVEIAELAAGYAPQFVRPQAIVGLLPFVRDFIDLKGNAWLNDVPDVPATPATVVAHPRIIQPQRRGWFHVAAAGGGGTLTGDGNAAGTGAASGVGAATAAAVAATSGTGTATATGAATAAGVGNAAGLGQALGAGAFIGIVSAVGNAVGTSAALGVSPSLGGGVDLGRGKGHARRRRFDELPAEFRDDLERIRADDAPAAPAELPPARIKLNRAERKAAQVLARARSADPDVAAAAQARIAAMPADSPLARMLERQQMLDMRRLQLLAEEEDAAQAFMRWMMSQ